jgi:hypothetical protein
MGEKYKLAIRVGIIGGILTTIPMVLFLFVNLISYNVGVLLFVLSFSSLIFSIVVPLGSGLLVVYYTRPLLHDAMDAAKLSGSAGAINGITFGVVLSMVSLVWPYLGALSPNSHMVFGVASSPVYIPLYIAFCAAMNSFIAIIGGIAYTISKIHVKLAE